MTVKELIKKLKTMPQELQVYWADHDHGKFETGGAAGDCYLIDKSEMDDYWKNVYKTNKNYECFNNTPEVYIIIRP